MRREVEGFSVEKAIQKFEKRQVVGGELEKGIVQVPPEASFSPKESIGKFVRRKQEREEAALVKNVPPNLEETGFDPNIALDNFRRRQGKKNSLAPGDGESAKVATDFEGAVFDPKEALQRYAGRKGVLPAKAKEGSKVKSSHEKKAFTLRSLPKMTYSELVGPHQGGLLSVYEIPETKSKLETESRMEIDRLVRRAGDFYVVFSRRPEKNSGYTLVILKSKEANQMPEKVIAESHFSNLLWEVKKHYGLLKRQKDTAKKDAEKEIWAEHKGHEEKKEVSEATETRDVELVT